MRTVLFDADLCAFRIDGERAVVVPLFRDPERMAARAVS